MSKRLRMRLFPISSAHFTTGNAEKDAEEAKTTSRMRTVPIREPAYKKVSLGRTSLPTYTGVTLFYPPPPPPPPRAPCSPSYSRHTPPPHHPPTPRRNPPSPPPMTPHPLPRSHPPTSPTSHPPARARSIRNSIFFLFFFLSRISPDYWQCGKRFVETHSDRSGRQVGLNSPNTLV